MIISPSFQASETSVVMVTVLGDKANKRSTWDQSGLDSEESGQSSNGPRVGVSPEAGNTNWIAGCS